MSSGPLYEQGAAIDLESVNIQLENNDHCSILELNVTLPDR
jgi:cell division topological specificity factor